MAPCADVACTSAGACWGAACACDRPIECQDPSLEQLNGPFAEKIMGIDFADDCTAWMVTLRSGTDYLRRLRPDGELTEWPGVSNLDMGEVKVLRRLTIPQLHEVPPVAGGRSRRRSRSRGWARSRSRTRASAAASATSSRGSRGWSRTTPTIRCRSSSRRPRPWAAGRSWRRWPTPGRKG
ncbi:hypothetical protein [Nannocystis pusilla]|uniref:hypothetical protein n=1 Tax=Nannocystis pusilla TaxID=889268 RepID=UPI003B81337B